MDRADLVRQISDFVRDLRMDQLVRFLSVGNAVDLLDLKRALSHSTDSTYRDLYLSRRAVKPLR